MSRIIIISNRLPIKIEKLNDTLVYKPSEGGLATGLSSVYKKGGNLWIGWPGIVLDNDKDKKEVVQDLKDENMAPVFLTEQDLEVFYEGFSNATLWPYSTTLINMPFINRNFLMGITKLTRSFAISLLKLQIREI